ncbi:uncharacterized protein [Dermacentor albipictus]|uniref:uncharacterized protein n=1 Tax=Dermacentor albipictus TaxID=60249 RepID=UPI0031FE1FC2
MTEIYRIGKQQRKEKLWKFDSRLHKFTPTHQVRLRAQTAHSRNTREHRGTMSSDSSASPSSSQVNLSTEMGGRRIEVNAVRTGSQEQQQAGSSQSEGIKTTISHSQIDYSVGAPTPRANLFVPNSPYAMYDPYNPYSPYNPYNPYIVYAPRAPCPIHGYQAPPPAASPQPSGASVPAQPASEGTSLAGPAAPRLPLKFEVNGRQIIIKEGFDIQEEYINDRLVSRTVNGVRETVPQKK